MASQIDRARHGGCLFLADGPPLLYDRAGDCRLTKYQFAEHLADANEADAIGTNQQYELARVLGLRPAIIVRKTFPTVNANPLSFAQVDLALNHGYRRLMVQRVPVLHSFRVFEIWQRRDLPPPRD
jgi:hypothetical protein